MSDKIADMLDGMEVSGIRIYRYAEPNENLLKVYLPSEEGEPRSYIEVHDGNLLAFCRAVVGKVDGKNKKLQKIFNALDNHLGDTDPDILEDATDEEICDEEPVFWAANEIAKILKENK